MIPAEGGTPREVTAGRPKPRGSDLDCLDGDGIVFAGMPWLEYGNTAGPNIHIADVKTSQISDRSGFRESFQSPLFAGWPLRGSPLRDSTKLMLYDIEKNSWSQLADIPLRIRELVTRWEVSYMRKIIPTRRDDIVRVNVTNGKMERLLTLKEIPRGFDPWEFWVGLAPDDSPLLMRDKSTQEIYSLDVRFP